MSQKSHASLKPRQFLGWSLSLALLALSLQVLSPTLTPSAEAGSTTLCSGFSDCSRKGMSSHGYKSVWHKMFWLMFPYRNCVNYVAFKVIQDGGPTSRPWRGEGNAENWGKAMRHVTDQNPTVGSVAWWDSYEGGVSRYGHVAYVEKVVSPSEIVISESNYGSDFSWRRVTKGRGWPSGFIHFTDSKTIRNVATPKIVGTPRVGEVVSVRGGKWQPTGKPSLQWYADGTAIRGATDRSFRVGQALVGKRLSAKVTGTRAGWRSGSVTTPSTSPVSRALPDYRRAPAISGSPEVGKPLTVVPGVFFPRGGERTFRWYADGVPVPGATGKTFTPTRDQLRKRITVRQRVAIPGYQVMEKDSAATGIVMAPPVAVTRTGGISGTLLYGRTLTIDPGSGPAAAWQEYTWRRNGVPIPGATGRTYKLGAADLGKRITGTVRWKQKRFRNTDYSFSAGVVRSPATIHLVTESPKPYRGVAKVRVTAPGTSPSGRVTVRIGRFTKTEYLGPGKTAWIGFDGMTRGSKKVSVTYSGSTTVTSDTASGSVWIRR